MANIYNNVTLNSYVFLFSEKLEMLNKKTSVHYLWVWQFIQNSTSFIYSIINAKPVFQWLHTTFDFINQLFKDQWPN